MKQYSIRYKQKDAWYKVYRNYKSLERAQSDLNAKKEEFSKNGIDVDGWKIVCREISEWKDL